MFPATFSRRQVCGGLAALGTGLAFSGCANKNDRAAAADPATPERRAGRGPGGLDVDKKIMTFALNLEYLEAEYYTRGAYGHSLAEHGTDVGRGRANIRGGRKVHFSTPGYQDHAEELAFNEAAHVAFYRKTLGRDAVEMPEIDFDGGFSAAAAAAGIVQPGERFDPFADENSFFLGGMLFEDVGVTAYHGAAPLITSKEVLDAASGILAVEAYHMGMARFLLYHAGEKWRDAANKVSDARDLLDGGSDLDQPLVMDGKPNIVPNDKNGIAFKRTPRQVLNIVYLKPGATRGGFYPQGINGDFAGLV